MSPRETLSRLRATGPWLLRDLLRAGLIVILAAVSAFYLTRWGLANRIPVELAWTLPAALDCSALLGIVVSRNPASPAARQKALRFAFATAGLSAMGNGAMHAVDFGALNVNLWTVIATGAVYPVLLAWGADVASGMVVRPAREEGASDSSGVEVPQSRPSQVARPAPAAVDPTPVAHPKLAADDLTAARRAKEAEKKRRQRAAKKAATANA